MPRELYGSRPRCEAAAATSCCQDCSARSVRAGTVPNRITLLLIAHLTSWLFPVHGYRGSRTAVARPQRAPAEVVYFVATHTAFHTLKLQPCQVALGRQFLYFLVRMHNRVATLALAMLVVLAAQPGPASAYPNFWVSRPMGRPCTAHPEAPVAGSPHGTPQPDRWVQVDAAMHGAVQAFRRQHQHRGYTYGRWKGGSAQGLSELA